MIQQELRRCSGACKQLRPVSEFNEKKRRAPRSGRIEYQSHCRECNKQYQKEHYRKYKDYYLKKAKVSDQRLRDWLWDYKKERGCSECPEDHPCCLDFHHRDEATKEWNIADAVRNGFGKKRLLEEIAKCVLLCSNCHRKHHHEDRQQTKNDEPSGRVSLSATRGLSCDR